MFKRATPCVTVDTSEAQAAPPLLHVFGHIHGGHGVHAHAALPATTFVNAAVCDDEYRPVQKPVLVTLEPAGTAS